MTFLLDYWKGFVLKFGCKIDKCLGFFPAKSVCSAPGLIWKQSLERKTWTSVIKAIEVIEAIDIGQMMTSDIPNMP